MRSGRKYCKICVSPYRGEIEELYKRKVPMSDINRKYCKLFDSNEINFYSTITRHINKKHPPIIRTEPIPIEERKHIGFDEYADMLLQEGAVSVMTNPEKITHSAVIAAKRTQIEEAKAKNQIDATKLLMLKFFRGNAIEGEVVEDVKQIGGETIPSDTNR